MISLSTKLKIKCASFISNFLVIFLGDKNRIITRNSINYCINLREGIDLGIFLGIKNENSISNIKKITNINEKKTIIDIGANIGSVSLPLAKMFKNSKIIHISSDGVFNGSKGNYLETDKPSSMDIYGISKIIGEIKNKNVMNIRCSIIGFEKKTNNSILSWFLKKNSRQINGYNDQIWNGITTHALSKICIGIIKAKLFRKGTFHIFSKNKVTKYKLLCILNEILNNNSKKIKPIISGKPNNTSLATIHSEYILKIWKSSGYKSIPTIKYLIKELI